ncbi:hypothetical protein HDV00_003931 [Rhizophlyctis rosea]|nr:hypothetical protein HDV00_003931 [Rhizophlyctis rosea]
MGADTSDLLVEYAALMAGNNKPLDVMTTELSEVMSPAEAPELANWLINYTATMSRTPLSTTPAFEEAIPLAQMDEDTNMNDAPKPTSPPRRPPAQGASRLLGMAIKGAADSTKKRPHEEEDSRDGVTSGWDRTDASTINKGWGSPAAGGIGWGDEGANGDGNVAKRAKKDWNGEVTFTVTVNGLSNDHGENNLSPGARGHDLLDRPLGAGGANVGWGVSLASTPPTTTPEPVRCSYWPNCTRGRACRFWHPTKLCLNPDCPNGKNCRYIHKEEIGAKAPVQTEMPECRFGAGCTRPGCKFKHTTSGEAPAFAAANIPCRYYPNCKNAICPYYHPPSTGIPITAAAGPDVSKVPCKYEPFCDRAGCPYAHTLRDISPPQSEKFKHDEEAQNIAKQFGSTSAGTSPHQQHRQDHPGLDVALGAGGGKSRNRSLVLNRGAGGGGEGENGKESAKVVLNRRGAGHISERRFVEDEEGEGGVSVKEEGVVDAL